MPRNNKPSLEPDLGARIAELTDKKSFWFALVTGVLIIWLLTMAPDSIGSIVFVVGGVALYFFPSLVARKKPNANSVFVVNFFLGWTLVGWVVALAMASNNPQPQVVVQQATAPMPGDAAERTCPFCAEDIKAAAVVCKHCGRDLPGET